MGGWVKDNRFHGSPPPPLSTLHFHNTASSPLAPPYCNKCTFLLVTSFSNLCCRFSCIDNYFWRSVSLAGTKIREQHYLFCFALRITTQTQTKQQTDLPQHLYFSTPFSMMKSKQQDIIVLHAILLPQLNI